MNKENYTFIEILQEDSLILWYFKADTAAQKYWENWAEKSEKNKQYLCEAKAVLDAVAFSSPVISKEQINSAWHRLNQQIMLEDQSAQTFQTKPKSYKLISFNYKQWLSVAAILIGLLGIGYMIYQQNTMAVIATSYGQISKKILADGSEVILNANSSIKTNNFNTSETREVWLKGEAFFEVNKIDQKDKFIVHTDKIDIVVTGTQFNVINRDHITSIFLKEGSITLKTTDGQSIYMKPGEYIELKNHQVINRNIKDKTILAWQERMLIFDSTRLEDIAMRLTDVYGINIQIQEGLKNRIITGVMPNDDLNIFLKAFELSQDFKILRHNDGITITSK